MFYESDTILNMDNNKLKNLITTTSYKGYRLGDIVLNYPCNRDFHLKNCYLPHKKNFPNSLAINYTKEYKGEICFGKKINLKENYDNNLDILIKLIDNLNIKEKPDKDSLVVSIRLGDMVEKNKEKKSGKDVAIQGGNFWTQGGGNRIILSANDIIKCAEKLKLKKIILIGSKAIGTGIQSVYYLKTIIKILIEKQFEVKWFYSISPDEDLAFISYANQLLTGPGGFCLIGNLISNYRFNKKQDK